MQSKSSRKLLAIFTMSFGMLFGACTLPAYGQQEVSPDWYNPWTPPAASAQSSHVETAKAANTQHPVKVKSVSATQTAKARSKRTSKVRPS